MAGTLPISRSCLAASTAVRVKALLARAEEGEGGPGLALPRAGLGHSRDDLGLGGVRGRVRPAAVARRGRAGRLCNRDPDGRGEREQRDERRNGAV